jgi:uncharacterized metal-binding protein YceD (DUF177 family)
MDALKFPIKDIPLQGLLVDRVVPVHLLQPAKAETLPVETLQLTGKLSEVGGEYLFRGHAKGSFEQACDRCLEQLALPFDVELVLTFQEGAPLEQEIDAEVLAMAEESEVYFYHGQEINLAPCLWEELALAYPAKFVCDFSDMTTCPQYKAPLDATSGDDGGEAPQQSQFAVLKDLLPELEQEFSEE